MPQSPTRALSPMRATPLIIRCHRYCARFPVQVYFFIFILYYHQVLQVLCPPPCLGIFIYLFIFYYNIIRSHKYCARFLVQVFFLILLLLYLFYYIIISIPVQGLVRVQGLGFTIVERLHAWEQLTGHLFQFILVQFSGLGTIVERLHALGVVEHEHGFHQHVVPHGPEVCEGCQQPPNLFFFVYLIVSQGSQVCPRLFGFSLEFSLGFRIQGLEGLGFRVP